MDLSKSDIKNIPEVPVQEWQGESLKYLEQLRPYFYLHKEKLIDYMARVILRVSYINVKTPKPTITIISKEYGLITFMKDNENYIELDCRLNETCTLTYCEFGINSREIVFRNLDEEFSIEFTNRVRKMFHKEKIK